ncbi:DCN1-like protein [Drosera capensis]
MPRKKPAQSSATKKASAKDFINIDVFFGAYASSPSGMIEPQGIEKLCSDLEVATDDVRILILAWKMKAAKQGYFTLEEWRRGLQPLVADTILKLKSSLPELQLEVRMPSNFADFHAYAFSYNLTDNEKQRYIDIGTICVLLPLVLGPYFPLQVNALVEYLQAQTEYKTISMDQWMSIYRFCSQELEKRKKTDEEKARETEANGAKKKIDSNPEFLKVKERLEAREETVKEIIVEAKKQEGDKTSKNPDANADSPQPQANKPEQPKN